MSELRREHFVRERESARTRRERDQSYSMDHLFVPHPLEGARVVPKVLVVVRSDVLMEHGEVLALKRHSTHG